MSIEVIVEPADPGEDKSRPGGMGKVQNLLVGCSSSRRAGGSGLGSLIDRRDAERTTGTMTRTPYTAEEITLCIYAARYQAYDFGGLEQVSQITSRSLASLAMKAKNLAALCDEQQIARFNSETPLSGKPPGESGRQTNLEQLLRSAELSQEEHLLECRAALASLRENPAGRSGFLEGEGRRVHVNRYERNRQARAACIEAHGPICAICQFDFSRVYGPEMAGFIHVHHLKPLSDVVGTCEVDPVEDLRPVCPNCHAVIHHGGRTRSIEEVTAMLGRAD